MKSRITAIFWAVIMIAAGVLFLLQETGVIDYHQLPGTTWAVIFAVFSGFFFLTYFLQGVRAWGWLFPAVMCAALALIIGLSGTQLGDAISGAPVLLAIAIPFLVAFVLEPKKGWWALIPAWVMICLTLVVFFESSFSGNFIGAFVLYSIALPFLVVYLLDRTRRWALIPAASLAVLGTIPLLENFVSGETMGLVVMLLFSIPFFVVYLWSRNNWWALIPAGVFASVAVVILYTMFLQGIQSRRGFDPLGTAILLTGIGLTFGALWLRRATQPTDWAKVPALVLFSLAALSLVFGVNFDFYWPVALIIVGAVILVSGLIKKPVKPAATIVSPAPAEKEEVKKPVVKRTVKKAVSKKKSG
jgi:hypothetical protein